MKGSVTENGVSIDTSFLLATQISHNRGDFMGWVLAGGFPPNAGEKLTFVGTIDEKIMICWEI